MKRSMDYLILDPGYNFGKDANVLFATNDKREAVEAAKDFGAGTVVVFVDREGRRKRIYTAPYKNELGLLE